MKQYKIIYHLFPNDDLEITIKAKNETEAIIFAKNFRKDAFSINEVKEGVA